MRESLEDGVPPEAPFIRDLLADGILDRDLAVTARGRRALALDASPARRVGKPPMNLSIALRGPLPKRVRAELEAMAARIGAIAPRRPLRARLSLVHEEDRALERPVIAKGQLDLPARSVRAHVAASSAAEAIDLLEARLRRNLVDLGDRVVAGRKEGRPVRAGEWRHGDLAADRPAFFDRAPEERQLVRRKAYASTPLTAEEAALELRLLDHDFHLFTDAASGDDAVVYVRADGVLGLKRAAGDGDSVEPFRLDPEPAPRLSIEQAIEWLNTAHETFLFFLEGEDRRGAVLYRRYDGNYGLLTLRTAAS